MATTLERRIESLEQGALAGEGVVLVGIGEQDNRQFCAMDGVTYTGAVDESPHDFECRMRSVANELNRKLGRPLRIICSRADKSI